MRRVRARGGFTLLEVMLAVALLAGALAVIAAAAQRAVLATQHARALTVATQLARARMAALEDELRSEGFDQFDEERRGTFDQEGFPGVRWEARIDKIELPDSLGAQLQGAAARIAEDEESPMAGIASLAGSFLATSFPLLQEGLRQAVRRLTLRVAWAELGAERDLTVVAFLTDPKVLGLAGALPAAAGATGPAGAPALRPMVSF